MLKNFLLIAAVFFSVTATAQKTAYRSYSYLGLLEGQSSASFQLTTSHGLEFGSYFAGLGVGLDEYRKWSLPIFVTASKYLFPRRNNLFVSANAGTHLLFNQQEQLIFNSTSSKLLPGFFGEMGLVYRFPLSGMKPGQGLVFGTYYSYKAFKEKFAVPGNCNNPPCADGFEYTNYQLNRWAFKLGFAL